MSATLRQMADIRATEKTLGIYTSVATGVTANVAMI
jgi:hypothetical protein